MPVLRWFRSRIATSLYFLITTGGSGMLCVIFTLTCLVPIDWCFYSKKQIFRRVLWP